MTLDLQSAAAFLGIHPDTLGFTWNGARPMKRPRSSVDRATAS